ncbi:hypothetical protein [Microbacterium sp. TWP3-1-2b2]|uniref:hypothetical protein n=1 Tax=Microbacterium sp. TWP3-1-2b2 TaxID=2804651 RepID=UPI003CFB7675
MERRLVEGAAPLPAPNAEIAQAYLDEVTAVRSRREARVDWRGAARLGLVDAAVLSVYVTIIVISAGSAAVPSSFIVFVGVYLIWMQLANKRREGYGVIGHGGRRWSVAIAIVLCVVLVMVLAAAFLSGITGAEIPFVVKLVPGALILLILGSAALLSLRASSATAEPVERIPLTFGARVATVVTGAVLAAGIWVLSVGDELLRPFFGMLLMLGYLGWWIAARVTERMPALGALWAWPQWTAFATSGAIIAAILPIQVLGATSVLGLGPVAAAFAFGLSVGSAFLDGRDG